MENRKFNFNFFQMLYYNCSNVILLNVNIFPIGLKSHFIIYRIPRVLGPILVTLIDLCIQ